MMLGVQHVPLVAVQRPMDVAVGEELFLQPRGPRHAERGEAFGGDPEIGLEDPLELEERLVVKADVRELGRCDSGHLKAVPHRVPWKRRVALLAREALFLRRGDDLAVSEQAGGAVVIERREAKNVAVCHVSETAAVASCRIAAHTSRASLSRFQIARRARKRPARSCSASPIGAHAIARASSSRYLHSGRWTRRRLGSRDRKSTRLNSSHLVISYAVFCLKKKKKTCET